MYPTPPMVMQGNDLQPVPQCRSLRQRTPPVDLFILQTAVFSNLSTPHSPLSTLRSSDDCQEMKSPSCLLVFCGVTLAAATTDAANCTLEQISSIATMPAVTALTTSCAGLSTATAPTTANQATFCEAKCLAALEAAVKAMPACELSGTSLSGTYSSLVSACKGSKSAAPAPISSITTSLGLVAAVTSALVALAVM